MSPWLPFMLALAVAAGGTPIVGKIATLQGFVDRPSARRFHERVVPLGGGIAIVLGAAAGFGVAFPPFSSSLGIAFWVGLALVAVVGFIDDRRGMAPLVKLGAQIAAAALLVGGAAMDGGTLPIWLVPFGLVWVVGIMNACNFLDNMDGILAGIAALSAAGFWLLSGAGSTEWFGASLAAAVTGAALGFLLFNFAPARIFMGDAGSQALGFCLAAISIEYVVAGGSSGLPATLAPVLLVLAYPVFDITFVTITRLRDNRKVYLGGRDHSTHRLNRVLMSPRRTAAVIYALTAGLVALGVLASKLESATIVALTLAATAVVLTVLGVRLARLPIH